MTAREIELISAELNWRNTKKTEISILNMFKDLKQTADFKCWCDEAIKEIAKGLDKVNDPSKLRYSSLMRLDNLLFCIYEAAFFAGEGYMCKAMVNDYEEHRKEA